MTEPRRRARRPGFGPVLWGSVALFAVLFSLLTYQLSAASAPAPRPVVQRKVIQRRVVTTVVPAPGSAQAPAGSAVTSSAPEVSSSAAAAPAVTSSS
jgi:hypothetical protein